WRCPSARRTRLDRQTPVIRQDSPDAHEDRIRVRAQIVDLLARFNAGDPAGLALGRRNLAIQGRCDLQRDKRLAGRDQPAVWLDEPLGFVGPNAYVALSLCPP